MPTKQPAMAVADRFGGNIITVLGQFTIQDAMQVLKPWMNPGDTYEVHEADENGVTRVFVADTDIYAAIR